MLILEALNIKKYYSDRLIIGFDRLKIYSGDRIGIVGQNGSGKTTLLNILSQDIEPDEGLVRKYGDIAYIRQFSQEDIEADPKVLSEFELSDKKDRINYSGGEKTRIKIANAFSSEKLLVFADEPTSNLDTKGVQLLKKRLLSVESLLLISHDRELLESVCNKILEVNNGKISVFNGCFSFYEKQKYLEFKSQEQEYNKYIQERSDIEEAIIERQGKSKAMRKAPKRMGNSEARLHKRESNEKKEKIDGAANILKTRLEKLEVKQKPKELPKIKLDFSLTNPPANKIIISSDKLNFGYDSKSVFDCAKFKIYNGKKTVLWGENGTGKTTLLNLISQNENDIYIVPKARIGYFKQGFENIDMDRSVMENVMKDSIQNQSIARTILARLLISGDDVFKKVGVLSGGERIKVSFAKLFVSNSNVLLLDEPTNYLDIQSIKALESVLLEYEGAVVFVSHDKTFVANVADRMLVFENQKIKEYDGSPKTYLQDGQNKEIHKNSSDNELKRMTIQLRMTEIISKLSLPGGDKQALEDEYQSLLLQFKQLNKL